MALVHVYSSQITNRQASPRVLNTDFASRVRHKRGVVTMTNGDDINSTYTFFSVPSGAIPISMRLSNVDTGAVADIGLYPEGIHLVASTIDADFFASATTLDQINAKVEVLREAADIITVATSNSRLWELVPTPPTTNPMVNYDVVATLTTAADITGAVLLELDYVLSTGESQA